MKPINKLLIIFMFISFTLFAQNKPYRLGTTAANFLEMGVGSAGNGMGDAYVSMAKDLSSIYWNPAGLGYMNHNEVQFSYQPWVAVINIAFAGGAIVLPRVGTFAFGVTVMDYGSIDVTNMIMQEGTGETYSAQEMSACFSYGRKLAQWFSFGATGKYISSSIWHMSASALALDLGVVVNTPFISFTGNRKDGLDIGMSISNYGTKMSYDGIDILNPIDILPNEKGNYRDVEGKFTTSGWELPLIFRIGVALHPIVTTLHKLDIAIDALHPNNNAESINIGAQYKILIPGAGTFSLRCGYKSLFLDDATFGLTFGGGVYLNFMNNKTLQLDYAFKEVEFLGNTSTYTVGLTF